MSATAASKRSCPCNAFEFVQRWKSRKPPTGKAPVKECSLRRRNGRRLLSKIDFVLEDSDTLTSAKYGRKRCMGWTGGRQADAAPAHRSFPTDPRRGHLCPRALARWLGMQRLGP